MVTLVAILNFSRAREAAVIRERETEVDLLLSSADEAVKTRLNSDITHKTEKCGYTEWVQINTTYMYILGKKLKSYATADESATEGQHTNLGQ